MKWHDLAELLHHPQQLLLRAEADREVAEGLVEAGDSHHQDQLQKTGGTPPRPKGGGGSTPTSGGSPRGGGGNPVINPTRVERPATSNVSANATSQETATFTEFDEGGDEGVELPTSTPTPTVSAPSAEPAGGGQDITTFTEFDEGSADETRATAEREADIDRLQAQVAEDQAAEDDNNRINEAAAANQIDEEADIGEDRLAAK